MTEPVTFNARLQRPTEVETIKEASRVAREIYDGERDYPRELYFFEQVYLTEVRMIGDRHMKTCGDAKRNPALSDEDREIVFRLALRTEAREMGEALRAYRKEREAFFNDTIEEVALAMSQAAE